MKSALMCPPAARELDPRAAREAEVAALPHDPAAQLGRVDADRVARAVLGRVVGLVRRLHDRADAAVPEQVDRRAQDRADQVVGRQRLVLDPERPLRRLGERDPLGPARPDAAALGDLRPVVVVPRGAREVEQPPPLREADVRVGVGVDEDVAVVVGADEADAVRQQHPVAEHVAGHVADPDDRERVARRVDLELAQVALDRLPGAARGDAELLVVIAARAARGERVPEPEAVLLGDPVGGVGERRGALVGGDDEVGVVARRARACRAGGRPRRRRGCR